MRSRFHPIVAAVLSLGAVATQAQEGGGPVFSISGFGTVGVVGSDTRDAEYVIPGQIFGGDKSWSGDVDTKLGLQFGAKFNDMFSATLQVLSKQDGEGSFKPVIEWAFAKVQATPGLGFRVGRMGIPLFAVSDFRDVGYANTWLRPPIDVYGQVPVSHFDGADVTWQTTVAGKLVTLQALAGQSSSRVEGTKVEIDSLVGVNGTIELVEGLHLRLGHVRGKLTVRSALVNQLAAGLRQTPFASVGRELDPNDKQASFTGIGISYDQGDWLAMLEYTRRLTKTFIPDTTGWYATVGYRIGNLTPYLTLSRQKTDSSNVHNTIPAGLAAHTQVNLVTAAQSTPQKTVALGVRWDAMRNVAVKAQFDRIRTTGAGQFYAATPAFSNRRVNVYSLAVDFVF